MKFMKVLVFFTVIFFLYPATAADTDYFPTGEWRRSTPEEQGVDSEKLVEMLKHIEANKENIYSIVIVRHGYVVHESYAQPFYRGITADIQSCTKSITSALIGMAIQDGKINSIDQKVLDFFPEKQFANRNTFKEQLTIRDLLTMSTGLTWKHEISDAKMRRTKDWTQFFLDRPTQEAPGKTFNYSNAASYLLSVILQKTTGMTADRYANEHLFTPLGMKATWGEFSPEGIPNGASHLELDALNMAKFGYLYLKNGMWAGKQLVSPKWIQESTIKHIDTRTNLLPGYGYQWWVPEYGGFTAFGHGGKAISVFPEYDTVVAISASTHYEDTFSLIRDYILPALKPLAFPSNLVAQVKLNELAMQMEFPHASNTSVSSKENYYSGKKFVFEPNTFKVDSLTFYFSGKNEAQLVSSLKGVQKISVIGLDGIYRKTNDDTFRGHWESDDIFQMEFIDKHAGHFQMRLNFSEAQLTIAATDTIERQSSVFIGKNT